MQPAPKPLSDGTILEDLPFCLARAALNFRRFNDRTLRAVGLDAQAPGAASVLHALSEQNDCTVSSLVESTHLPNGTLTGLLDSLERDRLVQRVENPADGRSWRIRLTGKGRRVCAKLEQRHRLVMDAFRSALTKREAGELKRLLARITDCMRAYGYDEEQTPAGESIARTAAPRRRRPRQRADA